MLEPSCSLPPTAFWRVLTAAFPEPAPKRAEQEDGPALGRVCTGARPLSRPRALALGGASSVVVTPAGR